MNIELEVELVFKGRAPKSYLVKKKLPVSVRYTSNSIEMWPVTDKLVWTNKPSFKELLSYIVFNPLSRLVAFNLYYDNTLLGTYDHFFNLSATRLIDGDFTLAWDYGPVISINTSSLTLGGLRLLLDTIEEDNVN